MAARRRRKGYVLSWHGERVHRHALRASREAIDDTMARSVVDAKANAPFQFGVLQGSIRIVEPARRVRDRIVGTWGSADVNYALAQEVGTDGGTVRVGSHRRRTFTRTSRRGTETVRAHTVRSHTRETKPRKGRYFLRGGADREYPKLTGRIRYRLERLLRRAGS